MPRYYTTIVVSKEFADESDAGADFDNVIESLTEVYGYTFEVGTIADADQYDRQIEEELRRG
jgi:hypothetical protein